MHLLLGERHLIKNFWAFAIISSVSSLHPNAWSNSPPPSMAVLNAAALVETFLVKSKPVETCSAGKISGWILSSTSCTGKNFLEFYFLDINQSSSRPKNNSYEQLYMAQIRTSISGDKIVTLLYLSMLTAWLRWYMSSHQLPHESIAKEVWLWVCWKETLFSDSNKNLSIFTGSAWSSCETYLRIPACLPLQFCNFVLRCQCVHNL